MFKNVAAKFIVFAFDATTNVPKTGDAANITAYVSKDYGAVTVLADTSATEMDATNAPGYYLFDAALGETNADCLLVSGKSSTANIKVIGAPAVIFTRPTAGWGTLTAGERTSVADAILDRDMATGADSGSAAVRTVRQALRALRNKWGFPAGTYTVYKEDDVTASWTGAPTTDAAAVPVVGVDPA